MLSTLLKLSKETEASCDMIPIGSILQGALKFGSKMADGWIHDGCHHNQHSFQDAWLLMRWNSKWLLSTNKMATKMAAQGNFTYYHSLQQFWAEFEYFQKHLKLVTAIWWITHITVTTLNSPQNPQIHSTTFLTWWNHMHVARESIHKCEIHQTDTRNTSTQCISNKFGWLMHEHLLTQTSNTEGSKVT